MDPPGRNPISVFVISDVRVYREALGQLLASTDEIVLAGTAAGTDDGRQLMAQLRPEVTLLDMATADAVWMAQRIADSIPATKLVALAVPRAEEELIVLVEAGVLGYVAREQSFDDVVAAIRSVAREEMVGSPELRTLLVKRMRALAANFSPGVDAHLTAREREILDLIARGLSNKEIAGELLIERSTVKNHVHNILAKLQVQTRIAAVARVQTRAIARHSTVLVPPLFEFLVRV